MSRNNIFVTIAFLKIMLAILSILSSILIYNIIKIDTKDTHRAKLAFLAFLFSPILFWVNFFQAQLDITGIFFTLLFIFFYTITKTKKENRFLLSFSLSLLLIYASFSYLIPIILIPVFIIYQENLQNVFKTLIALFLSFLFYYIPYAFLNGFNILGGTTAIATRGSTTVGYTVIGLIGLHMFPLNNLQISLKYIFELLFIFSIFLVPLILRIYKVNNIYIPTLINLASLFLFIAITSLDQFSWLVPLIIITFAIYGQEMRLFKKLILVQLYDLPYIFLFIIDDNDFNLNGSGIFYLSYLEYHLNIDLDLYPWSSITNKILVFLGFLSIVFLIFIAIKLWISGSSKRKVVKDRIKFKNLLLRIGTIKRIAFHKWIENILYTKKRKVKNQTRAIHTYLFISLVIAIVILSSIPLNSIRNEISENSPSNPVGIFYSNPVLGNSTSYKFVNNYDSVYVYPSNPNWLYGRNATFSFVRNLKNENVLFNLSIDPVCTESNPNFDYPIVSIGKALVNLSSAPSIPNDVKYIEPQYDSNIVRINNTNCVEQNMKKIPIFKFNGTSVMEYNLNTTTPMNSYAFIFNPNKTSSWTNQIMFLKLDNQLLQVYNPQGSNYIYLAYSNSSKWIIIKKYDLVDNWNLIEIKFLNNKLAININGNGYIVTKFLINTNRNALLSLGKDFNYSAFNFKYALLGEESTLFQFPNDTINFNNFYITIKQAENKNLQVTPLIKKRILIDKTESCLNITIDSSSYYYHITNSIFRFGRLGISPIAVIFTFNQIIIQPVKSAPFLINYIIIVFFPPILASVYIISVKRKY